MRTLLTLPLLLSACVLVPAVESDGRLVKKSPSHTPQEVKLP
jgi:hypothetical protein